MKNAQRYEDEQKVRIFCIEINIRRRTAVKDMLKLIDHQHRIGDRDEHSDSCLDNERNAREQKGGANQ